MVGFTTGFGTATPPTSTAVVSPRADASPNQPQPVSILYPCRSSARGPLPQVPQGHPGVAKRASISTLARGPSTEALLGQGRVAKGRKSVPLPGLWSGSRPGSAQGTLPQAPQGHPGVAMGAPDRVFVHEISLSHGHRGANRVFVHEMSLSHGHQAPDRVHHAIEPRISHITPPSAGSATSRLEPLLNHILPPDGLSDGIFQQRDRLITHLRVRHHLAIQS